MTIGSLPRNIYIKQIEVYCRLMSYDETNKLINFSALVADCIVTVRLRWERMAQLTCIHLEQDHHFVSPYDFVELWF